MSSPQRVAQVEYPSGLSRTDEGAFPTLLPKLSQTLECDHLSLDRIPPFTLAALTFRRGAKRAFHLRLFRKSGRYLVELSGVQPNKVLEGIRVCRDHFDRWFGITGREIIAFEQSQVGRKRNRKNTPQ